MNALLTNHPDTPDGTEVQSEEFQSEATPPEGADLAAQARALDGSLRAFIVERPLVALGAALVGGFVLGRLLGR